MQGIQDPFAALQDTARIINEEPFVRVRGDEIERLN